MTKCWQLPQDIGEMVADVAERVSVLERADGAIALTPTGEVSFPSGIDTGGVGDVSAPPPSFGPPDDPTGLGSTPGALYDDIYADVSWTAPGDMTNVAGYDLWLERVDNPGPGESKVLVDRVAVGLVTSTRLGGLRPNTTYDVTLYARNPEGVLSAGVTHRFTTGTDNTTPSQVTGLVLTSGVTTVVGVWDDAPEDDVRDGRGIYELQIDTVNTFNSGNLRSTRVGGSIASIGDLTADQTYFGRVRAIDSSGNSGPWSATATASAGLVETATIADAAIVTAKIGDAQITTAKIAAAQITTALIGDLQVTAAKIANATITNAQIANATITGAKIATATIDTANIADAAITTAKIGAAQITNALIANLAVGTAQIADAAITNAKIANLAVDTAQIASGAITNAKIGTAAIDTAQIADAAITSAKIADATITNADIANATITDAKIANLTVDKILTGTIAGKVFTLSNSTGSRIESAGFVGGSSGWRVRGNGDAEFNNVTVRGTVTSSTMTASTITGTTITGGTIRTASSGRRIVIDGGANLSQIVFYSTTSTTSGFIGWDNSRLALVMDTRAASAAVADIILDAENDIAVDALGIVRVDVGNIDGATAPFQVAENGTTAFMVSRDGNESRWWFSGENNDYIGYDNVASTEKFRIVMNNTEEMTLTNTGFLVPNVDARIFGTDPSVHVSSIGELHRNSSTLRFKSDVRATWDITTRGIIPLSYRNTRRGENGEREHSARVRGLGAEHVVAALGPDAGFYDEQGRVEDFNDRAVLAALVADVARLYAAVDALA